MREDSYAVRPHLIILGGGHVAQPLCRLARVMQYRITVMDDREEFANPKWFPDADEIICADFSELHKRIPEGKEDYYVIITRGHQADQLCVEQILPRSSAYVGMIGSRAKVTRCRQLLLEHGFSEEDLQRLHAPIGIRLGGQLPEEIAVSILAQIVEVKSAREKIVRDPAVAKALEQKVPGVLLTIIEKSGSAPRGVGSRMLVADTGECYGSIGGGAIEYQATKDALTVELPCDRHYDLSLRDAGNLGMVCGGAVTVHFERITYEK